MVPTCVTEMKIGIVVPVVKRRQVDIPTVWLVEHLDTNLSYQ